MDFYRVSGINTIYFSREGSFARLCELLGLEGRSQWSRDDRLSFSSAFLRFSKIYEEKGGAKLPLQPGDGFLLYLGIYGWDGMLKKSMDQLRKEISLLWPELESMASGGTVRLVTQPEKPKETSFIKKLIPAPRPRLTVGFLYYGDTYSSGWTYAHDLGRLYLENEMGDQITTRVYDGLRTDAEGEKAIEQAIADGCQVIFTTSVRFLDASIRVSIRHPDIRILNCSLNTYSGHMRTYYGRLYEAKFLVGMLAGILTDCGKIGYIAEMPLVGTAAAINAFALGVQMVAPDAKVLLAWSSAKEGNAEQELKDAGVSLISGPEMLAPSRSPKPYGLYRPQNGGASLASSIWHWGKFYEQLIRTIMDGTWKYDDNKDETKAINYWWGLSAEVIDVIYSQKLPIGTQKLLSMLKHAIATGEYHPFSGILYSQDGMIQSDPNKILSPEEIITMNWLADNVVGAIPASWELTEQAKPVTEQSGVEKQKG